MQLAAEMSPSEDVSGSSRESSLCAAALWDFAGSCRTTDHKIVVAPCTLVQAKHSPSESFWRVVSLVLSVSLWYASSRSKPTEKHKCLICVSSAAISSQDPFS